MPNPVSRFKIVCAVYTRTRTRLYPGDLAYRRIVDLAEMRIVDARGRSMILIHSDDRPIGKGPIVRFIVFGT